MKAIGMAQAFFIFRHEFEQDSRRRTAMIYPEATAATGKVKPLPSDFF
jgi:hypothetical protein